MSKDEPPSKEHIDQLCLTLGQVIIAFTRLEHALTMAIAGILGLSEMQERAVVRPMPSSTKTALLLRWSKHYLRKAGQKQASDTLKRIDDAADKRNDLVHGIYTHKKGEVVILAFSGGARLTGKPIPWSPRDLALLGVEVDHLRQELETLRGLFPSTVSI
jgi:hypothetical protein